MDQPKLTTEPMDDSGRIAELTISFLRILNLAAEPGADADEQLYLIRYEAANGLAAARSLSEPAVAT